MNTKVLEAYLPWLWFLFLAALLVIVHNPSFHAPLYWDDQAYIFSKDLDSVMPWNFWLRGSGATKAWPLTYTFFWFGRKIFGENPYPFHIVLLTLHWVNGILFYLIARRFSPRFAWLAAESRSTVNTVFSSSTPCFAQVSRQP